MGIQHILCDARQRRDLRAQTPAFGQTDEATQRVTHDHFTELTIIREHKRCHFNDFVGLGTQSRRFEVK
jgi:hypothetical protein